MNRTFVTVSANLLACGLSFPAAAEVVESASGGFATHDEVIVSADRSTVWQELVQPENWWSHTWSDDSSNLRLDPVAGGCFCETIPVQGDWPDGSVEHMRVIMAIPGSILRMSGSLGPLQSEGLIGTLTVTLDDAGEGTRIKWDYVTGGDARFAPSQLAPVVDGVQSEFLAALVARLDEAVDRLGASE